MTRGRPEPADAFAREVRAAARFERGVAVRALIATAIVAALIAVRLFAFLAMTLRAADAVACSFASSCANVTVPRRFSKGMRYAAGFAGGPGLPGCTRGEAVLAAGRPVRRPARRRAAGGRAVRAAAGSRAVRAAAGSRAVRAA